MTIPPATSTLANIQTKVRRLTASASESALSTDDINDAINTYYSQDFPYSIKIDQTRTVYTFYTSPYVDRYPLNVWYNQGVRGPLYVDGIQGSFFKDRQQFYALYPKFPTISKPISGDGVTTAFSFTIGSIPILAGECTLGGVDTNGNPIRVRDNGSGILQVVVPNPVVSQPLANVNVPGKKNLNTQNPGDLVATDIGAVDYVTGQFTMDFALAGVIPAAGTQMTLFVYQYQTGRPYSMLFWNNEFTIRPIPKLVHKIEIETYMTPVQFLTVNDSPIINQWWQLLAYGAAIEILRERQDMQGVQNLMEGFRRQEGLVLERQSVEEIFQPNIQLFNSVDTSNGNWYNNSGY